jgi:anaerobic magnesium-protoporphyrin IX monomethyl ester cyclase
MTQIISLRRKPEQTPKTGKLRVMLISPSYAPGKNTMYFPIGISYLSSYIRERGYEVIALNMNNFDGGERDRRLVELIETEKPDVIGIGGLTVAFNEIDRVVKIVREHTDEPVVLGGGITSCESELVMNVIDPDFMVLGEGETIFHELLLAIEHDGDPKQIKGIWCWDGEKPISTGEGNSVADLDTIPFPDLDRFGMDEYLAIQSEEQWSYHETRLRGARYIPITASRSCPFRCTFCHHAGMGDYKRHSIVKVVDHIEACRKRFGATYFMIYDELFSANKKRIDEFCNLLEERNLQITWYCQLRVDQLDQELLFRMKKAGCIHISYGFESGSDVVLKSMKKKIRAAQIAKAVEMTRAAKISIQANFLFGDPAETEETLAESLRFQEEHELFFVDWSAVIPYPGTQLFKFAQERGLIGDPEEFVRQMTNLSAYLWKKQVNLTELSAERYFELYVELREKNDANHRRKRTVIERGESIGPVRSRLTMRCPHCDHREENVEIPYPPEAASSGGVNLRSVVGVTGLNIVCDECRQKHHLVAKDLPHVGELYAAFQARIDELANTGTEIVMVPAMDRYFSVFSEDVDLSRLHVRAVFDNRPHRIGQAMSGCEIEPLERARLSAHRDRTAVVLPWVEYETAIAALEDAGFTAERIVSWNEIAGVVLAPAREELRPTGT